MTTKARLLCGLLLGYFCFAALISNSKQDVKGYFPAGLVDKNRII